MATGTVTAEQVYQQVISQGGSATQAQVAAALVSGIESGGQLDDQNPTSTASGLFQFLDTTWNNYDGVGHAGNASFEQQVAKFIEESGGPGGNNFYAWAPDLGGSYDGSGNWTQIGGKVAQVISQNSGTWGNPLSGLTAAQGQSLQAAVAAGGGAYLTALAAQQNQATGGTTATGGTAAGGTTSTPASTNIGGVTYTGTQQQTSALSTIEANLQTFGFTPAQVTQLTNWAWTEITGNVDPAQIAIELQAQPAFTQQYPGFAPANAQLNAAGLPAVSVQQYQQYQTQAQAMAQAAGLPPGFINSGNIGNLIGGNVSTQELSSRLNDALTLAYQSTPEQQAMFNQYFGSKYSNLANWNPPMTPADWQALSAAGVAGGGAYLQSLNASGALTPGQIAALALDPNVAEPLIAQQIKTAQIGGASVTSGVGALDVGTATELAKAGVTNAQATNAFQSLAPYSALETPRPGMGKEAAQGTVTADQLATGALLGNPQAQRQLQTAKEVAIAPFAGGGGYVGSSKGTTGAGSAGSSGAGQ